MQVEKLNIAFWRHSMRALNSYSFFNCVNEREVRELTRQVLVNNSSLSFWVDKLLDRNKGYHAMLVTKREDSIVNRQLHYLSKILISTVIKNDTGIRGGISTVFMASSQSFDNDRNIYLNNISIPSAVKYISTNEVNFNVDSLIDYRTSLDDYIIPFNDSTDRLNLSENELNKIDTVSQNIINNFIENNSDLISSDCFPFAIDFFIRNGNIFPFESHFPGRGLGVHFLPFLLLSKQRELFLNYFYELFSKIIENYGYNNKFIVGRCGKTYFHDLDRLFIELINNNMNSLNNDLHKQANKYIDLDVNDEYEKFPIRTIPMKEYSVEQIIISSEITCKDIPRIIEKLGKWVIVKSIVNIPWWSKYRKKPEVCIVDEKFVKRINCLLKECHSLIVQKLLTDSIDRYGHFGELRLYYMVMN